MDTSTCSLPLKRFLFFEKPISDHKYGRICIHHDRYTGFRGKKSTDVTQVIHLCTQINSLKKILASTDSLAAARKAQRSRCTASKSISLDITGKGRRKKRKRTHTLLPASYLPWTALLNIKQQKASLFTGPTSPLLCPWSHRYIGQVPNIPNTSKIRRAQAALPEHTTQALKNCTSQSHTAANNLVFLSFCEQVHAQRMIKRIFI